MKLYDKNAIARVLDITPKQVAELTEKGILKPRQGNLYNLIESNHAYIRFLRDENPQAEETVSLSEERAKLARAKRQKAELELAVAEGDLHRTEDIEKVISGTLINFKQRLSALPAEEADKLATMTDKAKIFTYLNGKIKKILLELSSFEAVFNEVAEDEEEHD